MSSGGGSGNVHVEAGPAGSDRRRVVIARSGEREICRDVLDANSERQREQFAQRVAREIGQPGASAQLCRDIIAACDRADEHCLQLHSRQEVPTSSRRGASCAAMLVGLAEASELFHTSDSTAYASLLVDGHTETWPLRSKGFKNLLSLRYYRECGAPPGAQAVQDALTTLEGQALFDGAELPVHTRLAAHADNVWLDLGDPTWSAVFISPDGWQVSASPPVKFRRPRGMETLPAPERGGSLGDLTRFLNISPDDHPLLFGWLVAAARPRGPYPVLAINGEQGCAKSTTSRLLRRLLDPNISDLRSAPRDERDLMIAASNNWILPFDNLSYVPEWLSDSLCRLATGGGFATRELYTDAEETLLQCQRPVILNGIGELTVRSDLLDRSVLLPQLRIEPSQRQTEATYWSEFRRTHPQLLGALLDAVAAGLRNLPSIRLSSLPRMADFATWVAACEPALPLSSGDFLRRYSQNQDSGHGLALESSPVTAPLQRLIAVLHTWEGTATELDAALLQSLRPTPGRNDSPKPRNWPANAQRLSVLLERLAPNYRQVGLDIEFHRGRHRLIRITRIVPGRDACDACVASATPPTASGLAPASPANSGSPAPGATQQTVLTPDPTTGTSVAARRARRRQALQIPPNAGAH